MKVLGFREYTHQAMRLAQCLQVPCMQVETRNFPDGETLLRLPASADHLVFCRSLDRPNQKLVELLLAARTARDLGARRLTLVVPYLCYMRQDMAFEAGQAVSQRVIGELLGSLFDQILTVDPHLHRVEHLEQVIPDCRTLRLTATQCMGEYLKEWPRDTLLIGPDAESAQWVSAVASVRGFEFAVARKSRSGDDQVRIDLPRLDCRHRPVVLVDDVISTGGTMRATAGALRRLGAGPIDAVTTHALFDSASAQGMRAAGIRRLISTDSVRHESNRITLAPLLAAGVASLG